MIWKIVKDICSVPLGIAAICGSVALAMVGLVVTSFMCYLFWSWVLKSKEPSIFGRKWEDDGDM